MARLTIGFTDGAGYVLNWPALCARALGFYRDEALDVALIAQPEAVQTGDLVRGAIDVARRGPDPHFDLVEAGIPVRIIAGLLRRAPLELYARPEIASVGALRGRTVAGNAAVASNFMLRMVLAGEGVDDGRWTPLETGGAKARVRALIDGRADAALLSPPVTRDADAAGLVRLLNLPERYPALLYSSIQVRTAFAAANGDALTAMLRADIRAQRWLADPANRGDAVAILARDGDMPPDHASCCYDLLVVRDRVYCTHAELEHDALALVCAALERFAGLRRTRPIEDYLDRRFLDAAAG